MYWQETTGADSPVVPESVIDMVFSIRCRELPVDHAHGLSQAILEHLPWIKDEPGAGIHSIHVAASGNGWMRPEQGSDLLFPSKRTKLSIRIPVERESESRELSGQAIEINGHLLEIGDARTRPLSTLTTIFSRHMVVEEDDSEEAFLATAIETLKQIDVRPKKMLCGIENAIDTPDRTLRTRSLMLAELNVEESVRLQARGIGAHLHLGCGIFIPHRGIAEIKED